MSHYNDVEDDDGSSAHSADLREAFGIFDRDGKLCETVPSLLRSLWGFLIYIKLLGWEEILIGVTYPGDGYISKEELKFAMTKMTGEDLDEDAINEMMSSTGSGTPPQSYFVCAA